MLSKEQLKDAANCMKKDECRKCRCKHITINRYTRGYDGISFISCVEQLAQTALAYMEMLERIQWKGIHSWNMEENGCPICGNEKEYGHASDCELAALLKG
jgi:hypothetical protein